MSNVDQNDAARNLATVQMNSKNTGIAALLVLFFGGLGFFYVSILGGIVTFLIEVPIVLVTAGFGAFIYHPLLVILAMILVKRHNKALLNKTFGK
jgi:hypothetical protein